jgi:MFS family permease
MKNSIFLAGFGHWFNDTILSMGKELRFSYLPPLMVYMAAGISGLSAIVGTFFVKDYLGLSAEFLAALAFWVSIPWALKMPIGHLVDLIWRYKGWLVVLGASLITASLLIMVGLLTDREAMLAIMSAEQWYVWSALLAPIGYVIQDVVADGMTVDAVPHVDENGEQIPDDKLKLMHVTMQTLGRVAIIGGSLLVALVNLYVFRDVANLSELDKVSAYGNIYTLSLIIPFVSVFGVGLAALSQHKHTKALLKQGMSLSEIIQLRLGEEQTTEPNWWILGGSLLFVVFTLSMGLSNFSYNQEIIFVGSMTIISFLIYKLTQELSPEARVTLIGTAIIIFVYRAVPTTGPGLTWWMIDQLEFDQQFFSVLSLIGSLLTLAGMFIFRRFMAGHSLAYIVGILTILSTFLALPFLGMFYGLHEWTSAMTGGVVDARFIAVIDTAIESPLGQIAMIPMLAWIANSAPAHLKATFFAVMASFTNLALSLSQLGTKYLNQLYTVSREVRDPATDIIKTAADYNELGTLIMLSIGIGLILPFLAIFLVKMTPLKSA